MSYNCQFKLICGIPLVECEVFGKRGWFAFDTGAMLTTLNSRYFDNAESKEIEACIYDNDATKTKARTCCIPQISIGNMVCDGPINGALMDMSYVENAFRAQGSSIEFFGSIGIDIIGKHDLLLDYPMQRIVFNPDVSFCHYEEVTLAEAELPLITAIIGESGFNFVLDTGASTCLIDKDIASNIELHESGEQNGLYVLPQIKIASVSFDDLHTVISDLQAIRAKVHADGILGFEVLSKQRTIFRFGSKAILLEKQS